MGVLNTIRGWFGKTQFREAAGRNADPDDEDGWTRITDAASKRDLTPLKQGRMQDTAVYLWDANLIANRLIELPLAYILAEGVSLRAPKDMPELQKVLDRFWRDPINNMDIKIAKKVRELSLFGEQCYPTFVNEVDGHVRLGYLDPSDIETVVLDPDNREQPIGIVTRKDKHGNARRYKVIVNGDESCFTQRTQAIRDGFTEGECFYFTVNDLSLSRRGRSDLRAQSDWADGYDQFMWGEMERYNFLRSHIWDVKLNGASPEEITQKAKEIKVPRAGSARVHNENEEWSALSPDLQATDTSAGARMFRNHMLGGATTPEHWFGGGGDVNRSTGDSMSEPTFKTYTMRQRYVRAMFESIAVYCIRQNIIAEAGSEPAWDDPRLAVEVIMPEMTRRDTTAYAAALLQVTNAAVSAVNAKLVTRDFAVRLIASIAEQLGVECDPEQLLADAEEEAAKDAENDTFKGPNTASAAAAAAAQALQTSQQPADGTDKQAA